MTVTATSYEAQVSAALVAMLAASSTFTTAGGSRSLIAEDDGGLARAPKNCDGGTLVITGLWAVVRVTECVTALRALGTYGHEGKAQVLIVLPRNASESHTDWIRRARNMGGGVRDDMNAMWGTVVATVPTPASAEITTSEPMVADDTSALAGSCFVHLEISWKDIP